MIEPVSSDSHRCLPPIDDHRPGWVILSRISLILRHIIVYRTCLEGVHALMDKVTLGDSYFAPSDLPVWYPPIDDHHRGWVMLPRISLILRHILVGLASSGLHRRRSSSVEQIHGWVTLTRISLIIHDQWPGHAPSDSTHWWPSPRLSNFTSYFTLITSYPSRTCIVKLWWTKSRLSDFDSYFTHYIIVGLASSCIIGLASKAFTLWWTRFDEQSHGQGSYFAYHQ